MKKAGVILILLVLFSSAVYASELKVTSEHPFLINNQWIPANQLKSGDKLTLSNGRSAIITKINEINDSVKVYNLETENYHDFIVNGVIVHNSNTPVFDARKLINDISQTDISAESSLISGAEKDISRALSDYEKKALVAAHKFGESDEYLVYPFEDISGKVRLLREAGFSVSERRIIIENGWAGFIKGNVVETRNLVKQNSFLYREAGKLGPIESKQIRDMKDRLALAGEPGPRSHYLSCSKGIQIGTTQSQARIYFRFVKVRDKVERIVDGVKVIEPPNYILEIVGYSTKNNQEQVIQHLRKMYPKKY